MGYGLKFDSSENVIYNKSTANFYQFVVTQKKWEICLEIYLIDIVLGRRNTNLDQTKYVNIGTVSRDYEFNVLLWVADSGSNSLLDSLN